MVQKAAKEQAPLPKIKPIVPYLHLPEKSGEKAYLSGSKCPKCGTLYIGPRMACGKCYFTGDLPEVHLSDEGTLYTWTIVHQSQPDVQVPFIAAIVDLKDGVSVPTNIVVLEPDPKKIKFGMPVKMVTEKAYTNKEGQDVIRYAFRPT